MISVQLLAMTKWSFCSTYDDTNDKDADYDDNNDNDDNDDESDDDYHDD